MPRKFSTKKSKIFSNDILNHLGEYTSDVNYHKTVQTNHVFVLVTSNYGASFFKVYCTKKGLIRAVKKTKNEDIKLYSTNAFGPKIYVISWWTGEDICEVLPLDLAYELLFCARSNIGDLTFLCDGYS